MKFKNLRNWHYKPISSITETITDYVANGSFATLKENTEYVDNSNFILIRLVDYKNNFNGEFKYITKKSYEFLDKTKLFGGEIIISNVGANAGTVFKTPYLKYKMSLGPNSILLKTKENDKFYYYWFKSIYGQFSLESIKTGSAQPKFNKTDFRKLLVPVPNILEQNRISNILNNLDKKIEVNNKIIANLEEQAQAIFKSWFVDFEPFQDGNFVESELGMIPEGWEVKKLKEIFEFKKGRKPKVLHEKIKDNYIPYLVKGVIDGSENPKFTNEGKIVIIDKLDTFMLMDGANSGNIYYGFKGALGSTFSLLETKDKKYDDILYWFLKTNEPIIKNQNTGSAIPHANKSFIYSMNIAVPDNSKNDKISKVLRDFRRKIIYNNEENKKLAEIRDALLPKLMSGEIDVSNIKIKGEEVKNE